MPNRLRLGATATIALGLFVSAGCVADPRTSPGPTTIPPGPTPRVTLAVQPTPSTCPAIEQLGAPSPEIELHAYGGFQPLYTRVLEARDTAGRLVSLPDGEDPTLQDLGRFPGGVRLAGTFRSDADGWPLPPDIEVEATLAIDGLPSLPVPVEVDGSELALALPDVDAQAAGLELRLSFHDDCFRYLAVATARLAVGSRSTVAACATDPEVGLTPYLNGLLEQPILVDGMKVLPTLSAAEPAWGIGVASTDYGTLFPGWDQEAAAVAGAPGSEVVVGAPGDLALTGFGTSFYLRADAVREFEGGFELKAVLSREPALRSDGTFRLRLPDVAGRYVTLTSVEWQAPCAVGTSIANFSVDVR